MSKQTKTADNEPRSLSDAGYRLAQSGDSIQTIARYVLSQCPGFLDDVPEEVKDALYAGFQTRKHELDGEKFYRMTEGGTFVPVPTKVEGAVVMSINAAMSYTRQAYGKLKDSDPALHAIIGPSRDAFSSYASNNMKALRSAISDIVNTGKPRSRSANKGFREAMVAAFEAYEKRVKTAKDRGDDDADPVRYRVARDAFWKSYDMK